MAGVRNDGKRECEGNGGEGDGDGGDGIGVRSVFYKR